MDTALAVLVTFVAALAVVDPAAVAFGVASRDGIADDHRP
jgi:hypothetical protein